MTAKELREKADEALRGLEGDTRPARKLIFGLAGELRSAEGSLRKLSDTQNKLSETIAAQTDRINGLVVTQESLRQRIAQGAAARPAMEGEITRLEAAAERSVSVEAALNGLFTFLDHIGDPARTEAELARLDGRMRQSLAYALGADPDSPALVKMSEAQVRLLFHLGFSEYHLLSTLCGNPNTFTYELK